MVNQALPFWNRRLFLILGAYLLLALAYGLVNPIFEAPDEHWHYFTAQYIAETGTLPSVAEEPDDWLGQEAAQPPLYYLLGALLIAPVDTAGAREVVWPNPFVQMGDASAPTNINAFVHGEWESWPWHGYVLAAHLLRGLSAMLGMGTLLCIYGSGRLLWPSHPERALLATAMIAFLPQFLFLHSTVTNDTLIVFLTAAALWQLLAMWLRDPGRRRMFLLGITLGLAILSKTAGLLLLAYAAGLLLLRSRRDSQHRMATLLSTLVFVILPAGLIGGWLLWRNWTLYGDVTAANQFIRIAGGDRGYTLPEVLAETPGLWTSLFAVFGWFNVRAPGWIYWVWNGLVIASLLGAWRGSLHRWRRHVADGSDQATSAHSVRLSSRIPAVLLALWVVLVYAGLITFMLRTPAAQGRLLFPALVPLALGFAYGLDNFPWSRLKVVAPLLALATSLYSLVIVIPAAYARPPTIQAAQIPAGATRLDAQLGQGVQIVAVDVETEAAQPGETVWMTLYWQAQPVPAEAPEMVLELFGREQTLIGKVQSYHGGGLYPANLWPENAIVVDQIGVELQATAKAPTVARIQLGLVQGSERVPIGSLKVVPDKWPAGSPTALVQLGEGILLAHSSTSPTTVRPGEQLEVGVEWQVTAPPGRDLTTFVHLGDPTQPPLAQGDDTPLGGWYPTGWWEADEVIEDRYELVVPESIAPGRYPLLIGMYDPETGARLPLHQAGERQQHDAYLVDWITVRSNVLARQ